MIRNFFSSAIRQFVKRKWMVLINLAGLSLGLATCFFIFLYLTDELSYEKSFTYSDRIYRVNSNFEDGDQNDKFALTSFGVGPLFNDQLGEVEDVVRIFPVGQQKVETNNENFFVEKVFFVDTAFLKLFNLPLIYGDYSALDNPGSILLSAETSRRLFGNENPMGKIIKFPKTTYTVKGVYDGSKVNTHLDGEAYLSINTLSKEIRAMIQGDDWYKINTITYFLLPEKVSPESVEASIKKVVEDHIQPWISQNQLSSVIRFYLEPLTGLRFVEGWQYDPVDKTQKSYLYIFSVAGILVLLLAVFNFINLATAAATLRVKEVAIRKVSGASRRELIIQFLAESALQVILAVILALVLIELLLPAFNSVTGKDMQFTAVLSTSFLVYTILLSLFVIVAGGAYPALFLSSLKPAGLFRQSATPKAGGVLLRKSLLVLQFSIAVFMIAGTWMVYRQLTFLIEADPGFSKENMLAVSLPHQGDSVTVASVKAFRNEVAGNASVSETTLATHLPGKQVSRLLFFHETKEGPKEIPLSALFADHDFLEMIDVELVEGRYFDPSIPADGKSFIINEAAVKKLGWTDPIGKKLTLGLGYDGEVIGVAKDFNYQSMHTAVEPLVVMVGNQFSPSTYLVARTNGTDAASLMGPVSEAWKKLFPLHPFDYFFIDDNWKQLYIQEENTLKVFGYFSLLSVLISCMGLIGLSSFLVNRRTREIGIRKTLGAGVLDLMLLLNKEYLLVVLFAILLALPISWLLIGNWLETFAFRTGLSVFVFAMTAIAAVVIAFLTVSVITWQKSRINPVKSLRYE